MRRSSGAAYQKEEISQVTKPDASKGVIIGQAQRSLRTSAFSALRASSTQRTPRYAKNAEKSIYEAFSSYLPDDSGAGASHNTGPEQRARALAGPCPKYYQRLTKGRGRPQLDAARRALGETRATLVA